MRQNGADDDFNGSEPWVILNPIEQGIKRKIESVGIPLKEWDVRINYGIKTGFNNAFIISTEKRNEIMANCLTEEERLRTEELIRPILRGRDIKRYGYEWAGKYLIATFPSRHYDIEEYPAVKRYLLSIGIEKLEQSGKIYSLLGKEVRARKKTMHKWFETQDSISYWDDFSKPKIVWGNLNLRASYALISDPIFINAPASMIVSDNKFLLAVLNSKLADFYIRLLGVTRNGGYLEYKPMFVGLLPVPCFQIGSEAYRQMEMLLDQADEVRINQLTYSIYGLSEEEILCIESEICN